MTIKDQIEVIGIVRIVKYSGDGKFEKQFVGRNKVVLEGFKNIAAWMGGGTGGVDFFVPTHFGAGTGAIATDELQTALQAEATFPGYARCGITKAFNNNQVTYTGVLKGFVGVVNEFGLFSAVSGGKMWARFLSTNFDFKQVTDECTIEWSLIIGGIF